MFTITLRVWRSLLLLLLFLGRFGEEDRFGKLVFHVV
jgi:hypothetical protein